jgi:hypothetical protein
MGSRKLKLPEDVIRHWPEVFRGIEIDSIPLEYLEHIEVRFKNKKIWIIETKANATQTSFNKEIRELFDTYGAEIAGVNFAIDSKKIKLDVEKGVTKALKNAKMRK